MADLADPALREAISEITGLSTQDVGLSFAKQDVSRKSQEKQEHIS